MKRNRLVLFTLLMASACLTHAASAPQYTGEDIKKKFKQVQAFNLSYQTEKTGSVINNRVGIYKINNQQCALVSRQDTTSHLSGTESVIYFYNTHFVAGDQAYYSYTTLKEGSKKSTHINYKERVSNEATQQKLRKDLNDYFKYLDKKSLIHCSSMPN